MKKSEREMRKFNRHSPDVLSLEKDVAVTSKKVRKEADKVIALALTEEDNPVEWLRYTYADVIAAVCDYHEVQTGDVRLSDDMFCGEISIYVKEKWSGYVSWWEEKSYLVDDLKMQARKRYVDSNK